MKKFIFLLFAAWSLPSYGTAAVIVATSHYYYLAADSAVEHTDFGVENGFTAECKIQKEGNIFFVPVGEYRYTMFHFNPFDVARNAIKQAGKIANLDPYLNNPEILKQIGQIARFNQSTRPQMYERWTKKSVPLVTLTFASYESDKPISITYKFRVDEAGNPKKPDTEQFEIGGGIG